MSAMHGNNGAVTAVEGTLVPALDGSRVGFDFDTEFDRIRVLTSTGQNLRVNPATGTVEAVDTELAYVAGDPGAGKNPRIVGAAYDDNFPGATTPTLYALDSRRDTLVKVGSTNGAPDSANTGKLTTVGRLGVNFNDLVGFDITADRQAFAALKPSDNSTGLYRIILRTATMDAGASS